MYKTIFITATDTGVGKSIFTSILAISEYRSGKKVAISKPIQTGIQKDTDILYNLTGGEIPIFNLYSFSLGAAPLISQRVEEKQINLEKVISGIRKLENEFDCVIVEGIGGIAVPLLEKDSEIYTIGDLIKDLNYPAIIVSRSLLGTINHTVLSIEFAKQKGLNISGFIVSGYEKNTKDIVIKTAPEVIFEMTGVSCLLKVPLLKEISYKAINDFVMKNVLPSRVV